MSGVAGATADDAGGRRRLLGAAAAALLVLLAVVLAIVGGGGDDGTADDRFAAARIASVDELRQLEEDLGHPLYWAGDPSPRRLEVRLEDGNAFVRYLPPGVSPGQRPGAFLTVGTYPVTDAAAATRRFARGAGAPALAGPSGSVVVPNPDSAGGVYLAYPDSDLQIEVFDPRPGRALALIRAEAIEPVGEG